VTLPFEATVEVGANVTWKVSDWLALRVAGSAGLNPLTANGAAVVTEFTVKVVVPLFVTVTV
jgi:hypothetical protein